MTEADAEELRQRFEALIEFIAQANDKALDGEIRDLGDLEHKISALCGETQKAPPPVARSMEPLLAEMVSRLDELEMNLRALQNRKFDS